MYKRIILGLLIALASTLAASAEERPEDLVLETEQVPTGGDFSLQSIDGPLSTKDLRGKLILLYFGYTMCPDVCPTSLSFLTQALNGLTEEELTNVVGIFVSVDPKRDSVEKLKQYVNYFHKNLIGVTGTPEEVAEVAKLYGAKYYEVELQGSAIGYSVNHSSVTYLIDKQGDLKMIFPHETPATDMLEAIRYLLAEE